MRRLLTIRIESKLRLGRGIMLLTVESICMVTAIWAYVAQDVQSAILLALFAIWLDCAKRRETL